MTKWFSALRDVFGTNIRKVSNNNYIYYDALASPII